MRETAIRMARYARKHRRPAKPETITGELTCSGKVGREVAELFAQQNRESNRREAQFWKGQIVRYTEEPA
jgi:hypothetical protein